MTTKKWRQVSVPKETMKRVDDFVENSPKYQSSSEFVRHAVVNQLLREEPIRVELPINTDRFSQLIGAEQPDAAPREKTTRVNPSLEEVTEKAAVEEG